MLKSQSQSSVMNKQQLEVHRMFLRQSLDEHRSKVAEESRKRQQELVLEQENNAKIQQAERDYKEYTKQERLRHKELIERINNSMIEAHNREKAEQKKSRRDPWGSNLFFEKLWQEKDVTISKCVETISDHRE